MTTKDAYQLLTTSDELDAFCQRMKSSPYVGFDTEFVSENRYRPMLCLLQVETADERVIIDTTRIENIDPFWYQLVDGDHITLAHAAREEFLFCYRAVGRRPKHLFDVQLAAGMIGLEYPSAYGNLVGRILGVSLMKGETRTDWQKRPLSKAQIDYALKDVIYLKPVYDALSERLEQLQRTEWLQEETRTWLDELEFSETQPQWQKVNGIAGLNSRALAIVRELWTVRDEEARKKNRSPRRVLPDDLMVELARRGTADPKGLKAIRGFESRVSSAMISMLGGAIEKANALPDHELPGRPSRGRSINLGLLGQFLTITLKIVCDRESIAAGVVGTAQDLRDLAAWHLKLVPREPQPLLATGWRATIIGKTIEEVIDGKIGVRVSAPKSDDPLDLHRI